eukprot:3010208-Amphidinium_carterae.1
MFQRSVWNPLELQGTRAWSCVRVLPVRTRGSLAVAVVIVLRRRLEHLHDRRIAYLDLKSENILIDDQGYIKLVDVRLVTTAQQQQGSAPVVGSVMLHGHFGLMRSLDWRLSSSAHKTIKSGALHTSWRLR